MRKNLGLLFFSALTVLTMSCKVQPIEEPAVPLELVGYRIGFGSWSPQKEVSVKITSGNGGYSLVYPKYITGLFEEVPYPDYLESILSIHIDEFDNIVIESRIGDEHPVHNFHGYFMVKDLKGKRTAFTVTIKSASINDSPPDPLPEIPVAPGEYYWVNY